MKRIVNQSLTPCRLSQPPGRLTLSSSEDPLNLEEQEVFVAVVVTELNVKASETELCIVLVVFLVRIPDPRPECH